MTNETEYDIVAELARKVERLESAPSTFLTPEEISVLSGRKSKSRQIEALRAMGVPFFINGIGHAVVARSAVEGGKSLAPAAPKAKWVPKVLQKG
ncbi:DUF4224 domain-containing protein [Duganella sp. BJB476]|nr:DUF4224 domain-containing protein [Duganella sp. BJB476]